MNLQSIKIGDWSLNISDTQEYFSAKAVAQAQVRLNKWSAIFPVGNTWIGKEYNVPSLIVRLDCMVDGKGNLQVCEIEDRPCGIGIGCHVFPFFKEAVTSIQKTWPKFHWVQADNRVCDDALWLGGPLSLADAYRSRDLILVRSRPKDPDFHGLEFRSVSTIHHEGDKSYGEQIGLWHRSQWIAKSEQTGKGYIDGVPMHSAVIKPLQGTRALGIGFYLTGDEKDQYEGRYQPMTLDCVVKRVRNDNAVFCQPFIHPMKRDHIPHMGMMYRFYFGYDCCDACYKPLGGMWMASKKLLIHGASDTITGPLLLG